MNKIARVLCQLLLLQACLACLAVHAQNVPFFVDFATTNYTMGSRPAGLWLGNLRGKGTYRDLVVANSADNTVGVRLCADDGTFGTLVTYSVGTDPVSVITGDFNRDNYDDVAVANFNSGNVSVLLNQKTGLLGATTNFPVGSTMSPGPIAITAADVNGDGKLDLIVANYNEGTVSILMGKGGGAFYSPTNYTVGANPRSVAFADLNGDGKLDILTANSGDGSITILYGAGDGTFPTSTNYSLLPYIPYSASIGDFNNDGIQDIVTANYNSNSISILLGQSDHTFVAYTNYPVGSQPVNVLVRNINNDTNVDLAVANSGSDDVTILQGLGNGSFVTNGPNYNVGSSPYMVVGSHFNNDNVTDLAVANNGSGSTSVSLLIHDQPLSYNTTLTAVENKPLAITLPGTVYPGRTISFIVLTNTVVNGTLLTNGPSPSVTFTSATNFSGTASFMYQVSDGIASSPTGTVTLNVLLVNHAPSFTLQTNAITASENASLQTYNNFATNLSVGPPNETGQTLSFIVTNDDGFLFTTAPAISPSGTLTFQPRANTSGIATVSARLMDNGGTANGGTNISGTTSFIVFVPPMLNHTNLVGTTNTFSLGATETNAPLSYVWQYSTDGVTYAPISRATNATYTITNIVAANQGYYSITVSNGAFALAFSTNGFLTVSNDLIRPTVTITTPASLQRISNNVYTATGTASDNVLVTNVSYSLNGASSVSATTTNQWKTWTAVLNGHLSAGTNVLTVQSVDFSGNTSLPSTTTSRTFFYVVDSTITILTNGVGTVSTNVDGHQLEVGRGYTIKAIPGAGQIFNSWNGSDGTFSTSPTLNYVMSPSLILQASFVPTPYTSDLTGVYNGLFYEDAPDGVQFPSSGYLAVSVNSNGVFSSTMYIAGGGYSTANLLFDSSGSGAYTVVRPGKSSLAVALQIDLTGGSETVTGLVTSLDGAWVADYVGNRAIFSKLSPAPTVGQYTFVIPGQGNPLLGPAGNSYGVATVAANGNVTLTGNLGDGTRMAQAYSAVSISMDGEWPVYLPLYKGYGAVVGNLVFNSVAGVSTNVSGSLVWEQEANSPSSAYPLGFTNLVSTSGNTLYASGYLVPTTYSPRMLDLASTTLTISGGDLSSPVIVDFTLKTNNAVTITGSNPNSATLGMTPLTAGFNGRFQDFNNMGSNPNPSRTITFSGGVIQDPTVFGGNAGYGEFLDINTNTVPFSTNVGTVTIP